jgi:hypothetical protein
MVAPALTHRSLEQLQLARIGIEAREDAERKRPLGFYVSYRKTTGDRNPERPEIRGQHFIEAEHSVTISPLHPGEPSDDYTAKALQCFDQSEVREHSINPVQVFSYVFQKQDGTVQRWEVRSPNEAMQQSEVAACQESLSDAAP